jgi:hypothetical protein
MASPAGKLLNGQAPRAPILSDRSKEGGPPPEGSLRAAAGGPILPQPDRASGPCKGRARTQGTRPLGDANANVRTLAAPAPRRPLHPLAAEAGEGAPREQLRFHPY